VQFQTDLEVDDPAYRLAEFAKRISADLIIVPSRGRTGLADLLVVSVAERLVKLSHCAVLVLRN
jgi:nucleotide-binding universal stress UspA family protein